jgi:PTH1 family peptidyl-tRNA hydrolase
MLYILGLGNPGKEYAETPHNIGLALVTGLLNQNPNFDTPREDKKFQRLLTKNFMNGVPVSIIIPQTFMNLSGATVADLKGVESENLIVVYDDIDLPFGDVRISFNRGSAGHNGIKHIEKALGTQGFIRIRVGVMPKDFFGRPRKPKGRNVVNTYLTKKKLSKRHTETYPVLAKKIQEIVIEIGKNGRQAAMNKFN